MTRGWMLGVLLTLTGLAFGAGTMGLGMPQPQRQTVSVRSDSYFQGSKRSRSRSPIFFSGSSSRRSSGGFSFGK